MPQANPQDTAARRPLKSRSTRWAAGLARGLLKIGLKPNQVSSLSVVFAGLALAVFLCPVQSAGLWLLAAAGIQLRLLCNLMDGMLAVEGGLKSHNGDLFNEFPDRLADVFILAGLGYAGGSTVSQTLGWCAACGALMTACVRMHGASLLGTHDFSGPMAKPHRMAAATFTCVVMAIVSCFTVDFPLITVVLALMVLGITITLVRRLVRLSKALRDRSAAPKT